MVGRRSLNNRQSQSSLHSLDAFSANPFPRGARLPRMGATPQQRHRRQEPASGITHGIPVVLAKCRALPPHLFRPETVIAGTFRCGYHSAPCGNPPTRHLKPNQNGDRIINMVILAPWLSREGCTARGGGRETARSCQAKAVSPDHHLSSWPTRGFAGHCRQDLSFTGSRHSVRLGPIHIAR